MKLNNKGWGFRDMFLISAILLIFLLVAAYYIFVLFNKLDEDSAKKYIELETELQTKAILFAEKYDKDIITLDDLKAFDYIDIFSDSNDNPCKGYVIVGNKDYKPYISCEFYETKNYDSDYE